MSAKVTDERKGKPVLFEKIRVGSFFVSNTGLCQKISKTTAIMQPTCETYPAKNGDLYEEVEAEIIFK